MKESQSAVPTAYRSPLQQEDICILDVDGLRLVINAIYYDGSPPTDRATQQQIVDTAQIEPPA